MRLLGTSLVVGADNALKMKLIDEIYSNYDNTEKNDYSVSNSFLKPFLTQKYPASVRGIKSVIAEINDIDGNEKRELEQKLFVERWCSKDNLEALLLK